jgi:putative glutamine amidotransferase
MARPAIGITTSLGTAENPTSPTVGRDYTGAVEAAGGVPVVLPPVDSGALAAAQLGLVRGLVIIGGPDYDPAHWGEKPGPATELIHPDRERHDLALFAAADRRGLPVLGICGGHQLINIARGGSLIQDVATSGLFPKLLCHGARRARHEVAVEPGSLLAEILGVTRIVTNSTHHQAVSRPGRNMRIVARSADGVAEAIEDVRTGRFVLGVQWHPERLAEKERVHARIFEALVRAARGRPKLRNRHE